MASPSMKKKDLDPLAGFRPPPPPKRPRMTFAQAAQLYLTIAGWVMWMVFVGYFGLRAPEQTVSLNLTFAGVIAVLTFVDLFGLWLVIGRWQTLKKAATQSRKIPSQESAEMEAENAPPEAEVARPESPSPIGAEAEFGKILGRLGVAALVVAAAIFGTGVTGWPLFLSGTGTIKGAIALCLTLWIFMEPIQGDSSAKARQAILAARTGLGLGLLCFASDHYFPWFGAAGVFAGGFAAALGKWGAGLYSALISGAAWAAQWWGLTSQ